MQPRVGMDVVTSCGKCKQRTAHVVFAIQDGKIKRVQCKLCLSYHNFKADPADEETDDAGSPVGSVRRRSSDGALVEPAPAKKKKVAADGTAAPKTPRVGGRSRREPEPPDYTELWTKAMHGKELDSMVKYRADVAFEDGMVVDHPSFGVGVVMKVSPEKRMAVLFRDGQKTLVCNR